MDAFFTVFLIAVSLSMDAFSLALVYGTFGFSRSDNILLAVIVGLFHFFMPLFGSGIGSILIRYFSFDLKYVVGIIFLVIGIEMFSSVKRDDDIKVIRGIFGFLLFGLSVSVDSFTTGIGLSVISDNYLYVSLIFMIVSGLFTYCGLIFGNTLNKVYGNYSTILGGIIICLLGLLQFFK